MARTSGTVQPPLTQQDLEYAADLLKWSRNLDNERILWEEWEKREKFLNNEISSRASS
jgi:hypothetical protein